MPKLECGINGVECVEPEPTPPALSKASGDDGEIGFVCDLRSHRSLKDTDATADKLITAE